MQLPSDAKILVADDSEAMLIGVRRALIQLGFPDVITVESGKEGLAALAANPDVGLVISDWNMEPVDGLEFLAAVRADARFRTLPFIIMSADAGPHLREQAAKLGVSLVLAKPFDAEKLRAAISTI